MINIIDKKNCCGCSACVQRCPKACISLIEDEEGFLYPKVDEEVCINCGLCEKVCPVLKQEQEHLPIDVFAAMNSNEQVRMQSSSGGVFSLLAEKVIAQGGVVFGASFNSQWELVHDYVETNEGIARYRGSKYLQRNMLRLCNN